MAGKNSTSEITIPPVTAHAFVELLEVPPTFEKPPSLQPRRLLPIVPTGKQRHFHSVTPEIELTEGPPELGEIALDTNTPLTGPGAQNTASSVGEPSLAMNGQIVFYTGNWYAAASTDAGKTFTYLNPATAFQAFDPPGSSFCCDQVVNYIPSLDTFVWLLQYGPSRGDNIQRLAFAKTADVAAKKWTLFDITTAMLGVKGAFLDFPDLAVGANSLYVTSNVFTDTQVGSVVVRIPFAGIAAGNIVARTFLSFDYDSFRVAQNCGTTALFAAHKDTSTLVVHSWPEADDAPTPKLLGVTTWKGGNGYVSTLPDGTRWLDRVDPRITGATLAKDEAWFAWTVDTGSNNRPRPFVQIARIDATDVTLLENINIFDPAAATAYGALHTNVDGEVGISYMLGGGAKFPSHVVGILTEPRNYLETSSGTRGPKDPVSGKGEWGDYLTVRRAYPREKLFAASGFTMLGTGNGQNRDVTPRFVIFGRATSTPPAT